MGGSRVPFSYLEGKCLPPHPPAFHPLRSNVSPKLTHQHRGRNYRQPPLQETYSQALICGMGLRGASGATEEQIMC